MSGARCGSSPRGRGTDIQRVEPVDLVRFIPAWAGNRAPVCYPAATGAVHPRVGGEQPRTWRSICATAGSSPRGRGTELYIEALQTGDRFIPAWAGNRAPLRAPGELAAVHPRVGGEQISPVTMLVANVGSSPRGRGTAVSDNFAARLSRFIPAWAGNRRRPRAGSRIAAVHPRVGGEQEGRIGRHGPGGGSSPRGRGTDARSPPARLCCRFIPAWAGNRAPRFRHPSPPAVHPRVGGEQRLRAEFPTTTCGSSPRGRGTGRCRISRSWLVRFIPAWAGNSIPGPRHGGKAPVHPRVGGEQAKRWGPDAGEIGSSPRGRGTGRARRAAGLRERFIPAWAGNRSRRIGPAPAISVHPRVGGEQQRLAVRPGHDTGSSPRGRGTERRRLDHHQSARFIPAWAGNSLPADH